MNFKELLGDIKDCISRGKGTFGIGFTNVPNQQPFTLILGSIRATSINGDVRQARGGYIVSLGLSVEQVEMLRDGCIELLKVHKEGTEQ